MRYTNLALKLPRPSKPVFLFSQLFTQYHLMKKAFVLALSLTCAGFAAQAQTAAVKPANAQVKAAGPQA